MTVHRFDVRRVDNPPPAPPKVLVVEDDYLVCLFAAEVLGDAGYTVRTAHCADEALAVIEAESDIDLLFTDIVMPGSRDGLMLAEQARALRPELRIVYTSGYAARLVGATGSNLLGPLLPKPYRAQQLVAEVSRV